MTSHWFGVAAAFAFMVAVDPARAAQATVSDEAKRAEPASTDAGSASAATSHAANPEDSPATPSATSPTPAAQSPRSRRAITLTAFGGWGVALTQVHRVDTQPFGFGGGGRFDFTLQIGLRLGVYGVYFAGKQTEQTYRFGPDAEYLVAMDSRTVLGGVSVGFDDVLGPVVLRYALDIGVTRLSWDFGSTQYIPAIYRTRTGAATSLHLAPGLGVLVPLGRFHVSADFRQHLDSSDLVPVGVLVYGGGGLRF